MLIIQGETDAYGTWRQVEAIRQQSGGPVEAIGIPDCGHAAHRGHSEVTLSAMTDFVRKQQF
jgi:pimeloyl-ACP methyl ester carboxylesterase